MFIFFGPGRLTYSDTEERSSDVKIGKQTTTTWYEIFADLRNAAVFFAYLQIYKKWKQNIHFFVIFAGKL